MNKLGDSLVAQMVKNLSAVWETQVRSLGQEDPLEKGMTTHSSILAWKIPVESGAPWGEMGCSALTPEGPLQNRALLPTEVSYLTAFCQLPPFPCFSCLL